MTAVITTAHLTLIVVLAIVVILAIWWGARRRRERLDATRDAVERREQAGDAAPSSAIDQPPVEPTAPVEAPPVTRSPPPAEAVRPVPATPIEPPPVKPSLPPIVDVPATPPVPAAPAPSGDSAPVTTLKGLGPKVATRLAELDITTVDQLAALSPAEAEALDAQLGTFSGRMARDRWIEQAKLLAAGDRAGFEATFGKLG